MILIGQYDSPFVRRVGIALTLYGMAFEHRPWSVFGEGEKVRAVNPLMRVPVLVLDDGTALVESHMMLDYLDNLVDAPLFPRTEPDRHRALRIAALATGLAEKAVSLFYERRLHPVASSVWEARCRVQIGSVLEVLEAERPDSPWWFGATLGHADIALACALGFATEALPGLIDMTDHPRLAAHADRAEALDVFQRIRQPFAAPA
ncbi:glutathione S-transferase family protein [Tabrizicola oligotrophica]|uniref:Glutathione S-transferase family protein n=1 Tax=Tabrizicola oligotrophica TaxID=2710650 RepID=A0A6M0QP82_9RHOB|nr:glutathione S-transferase family protein [Tabrizicola oligotrophica]NEY88901.1 glutathione S-transferase family protein [Tabrizicola oligotrophica]